MSSIEYKLIKVDENKDFTNLYNKVQPYYIWEPHSYCIDDRIGIWPKYKAEPIRMSVDEYNEDIRNGKKFLLEENKQLILVNKPSLPGITLVGYLFDRESNEKKEPDSLDKAFIETKGAELEKHELYGLHTYGGYYGIFRPDLAEVMTLLEHLDSDQVERFYVTTDAHPSGKPGDCYDVKADRHRAKTTVYVVKKALHPTCAICHVVLKPADSHLEIGDQVWCKPCRVSVKHKIEKAEKEEEGKNNKRKLAEEAKKEEQNNNKKAKSNLNDSLDRFLCGDNPITEGKDEKYDEIWNKLCCLEQKSKGAEKITEADLLYLFQAWSAPGSYESDETWLKFCAEKCNQGDILYLAK